MAFEADWGASTVLEARWVASTARSAVSGERWAPFLIPNSSTTSRGSRDEALRNSGAPTVGSRCWAQAGGAGNSEFRIPTGGEWVENPKSEIRNPKSLR
jgi:hypothetical protein